MAGRACILDVVEDHPLERLLTLRSRAQMRSQLQSKYFGQMLVPGNGGNLLRRKLAES
jgi:hypothetical protein